MLVRVWLKKYFFTVVSYFYSTWTEYWTYRVYIKYTKFYITGGTYNQSAAAGQLPTLNGLRRWTIQNINDIF